MKRQLRGTVAFAVCGSFCTLGAAVAQAEQLVRQGWELLPVMSYAASGLNTRFGRADEWKERLETLTGHRVLDTLQDVEPLGPRQLARALVVAPCTGTTLARLAAGLSDTPVTLAAKSLLRVGCPVVVATPYSSRGVNRLLAAVDRVVHFPPVPHTLGDTHIQTVLAAAVRPGNRVRTFRRCRVWTAALCVTLWALAALLLALLLHFGRG